MKVRCKVWEMLLTSTVLAVVPLSGELLLERARCATMCKVARTLHTGGLVVHKRRSGDVMIIHVPDLELAGSGLGNDQIVP
jgi:hypothetical protein